jgi:hypothetical protein
MGASLVVQVLANWSHLSDRAFRVLVRMAVTALDKPQNGQPAAIYHGGRELLAMSLRSKGGTDRTRYRSVAEAVAELTDAGAIQHLAIGWAGQNAVYRLTLSNVKAEGMGGPRAHPVDGSIAHPMDVPTGTKRMGPGHTPRNQEDLQEERAEEEVGLSQTTSHPPRATAPPIPTPSRCPTHDIPLKPRTDGKQACGFCRREQRAGPPNPEPDPPPTRPRRCDHTPLPGKDRCRVCAAEQDIAPVYDLASRRTA